MKRQTHREKKRQPPPDNAPDYQRTCTRCYRKRNWTVAYCPNCGDPEFMLPDVAKEEGIGE